MHTEHKLIIPSSQPSSSTLSSAATPLFMPTTPLPSPSIMSTPESSLRVRTGIPFLIMPNPLSRRPRSTASSHRLGGFSRPLAYHRYRDAIPMPSMSSPFSDKTGVPEHSGTAPWPVSELPTGSATLLLLQVVWTHKIMGDATIWIRILVSSLKHRRKRRMTLVATLCPVLLNLIIQNCCFLGWVGKNLDDFLTLLHVTWKIWSHFWKLN